MKQQNKLNSDQQQEHVEQNHATQNTAQEFSTVEDMLRFDAGQTSVPAGIAQRLQESSANIPRPSRSLWQRLFGK